jgi:TPR repeat protein
MSFENDEYVAGQAMEAGAYHEAVPLLLPLAERNSRYALLALAWIYESGVTGNPDKDAARELYEQAAINGSVSAYRYLGWLLYREGQRTEALSAFERGAQLGDEECKAALERFRVNAEEKAAERAYDEGNYEEAVRLLTPLAELNSEYALCRLGYISELGLTGPPDWESARSYYRRAAAQGDADAAFNVGRLHSQEGKDVQARAAFQAGAERAHLSSMSRLGRMLVDGRGGPADLDAGIAWLGKAAAKGDILAQEKLLTIEKQSAKSIFKKLAIRVKIATLSMRWARQIVKRPHAEEWLRSLYLRNPSKRGLRSSRVWKWLLRLPPAG